MPNTSISSRRSPSDRRRNAGTVKERDRRTPVSSASVRKPSIVSASRKATSRPSSKSDRERRRSKSGTKRSEYLRRPEKQTTHKFIEKKIKLDLLSDEIMDRNRTSTNDIGRYLLESRRQQQQQQLSQEFDGVTLEPTTQGLSREEFQSMFGEPPPPEPPSTYVDRYHEQDEPPTPSNRSKWKPIDEPADGNGRAVDDNGFVPSPARASDAVTMQNQGPDAEQTSIRFIPPVAATLTDSFGIPLDRASWYTSLALDWRRPENRDKPRLPIHQLLHARSRDYPRNLQVLLNGVPFKPYLRTTAIASITSQTAMPVPSVKQQPSTSNVSALAAALSAAQQQKVREERGLDAARQQLQRTLIPAAPELPSRLPLLTAPYKQQPPLLQNIVDSYRVSSTRPSDVDRGDNYYPVSNPQQQQQQQQQRFRTAPSNSTAPEPVYYAGPVAASCMPPLSQPPLNDADKYVMSLNNHDEHQNFAQNSSNSYMMPQPRRADSAARQQSIIIDEQRNSPSNARRNPHSDNQRRRERSVSLRDSDREKNTNGRTTNADRRKSRSSSSPSRSHSPRRRRSNSRPRNYRVRRSPSYGSPYDKRRYERSRSRSLRARRRREEEEKDAERKRKLQQKKEPSGTDKKPKSGSSPAKSNSITRTKVQEPAYALLKNPPPQQPTNQSQQQQQQQSAPQKHGPPKPSDIASALLAHRMSSSSSNIDNAAVSMPQQQQQQQQPLQPYGSNYNLLADRYQNAAARVEQQSARVAATPPKQQQQQHEKITYGQQPTYNLLPQGAFDKSRLGTGPVGPRTQFQPRR